MKNIDPYDKNRIVHACLTKLETRPEGILDPNGAATGGIINPGYTVKGYYIQEPTLDQPFTIFRYERNGERVDGIMKTSRVIAVYPLRGGEIEFTTTNSIYRLAPIL